MALHAKLVTAAKRSRRTVIAGRIGKDRIASLGMRMRVPIKRQGATHRGLPIGDSVAYVNAVYSDYLRYAALEESRLIGASVLELGPGDNFGVALRLSAAGARRVTTLDRFTTWRDTAQQDRIYRALLADLSKEQRTRGAQALTPTAQFGLDKDRVRVIQGVAAEDAATAVGTERFDVILSRAVLEHVNNPRSAFAAMDALLVPGGLLIHKVDMGDHGLFTRGGHNPLTFLTIPDRLYRWMGEHSGLPNRHLANWYRDEMERCGYKAWFLVTHLIAQDGELIPHLATTPEQMVAEAKPLIDEIRPRLLPRFQGLGDQDLATAGIFMVAQKPAR
jgi:SAM-dependent methyltransferase